MNIFEGLQRSRTFLGVEPALWFENVTMPYEMLYHQALRIAHALKKEGVSRGDRVCLFLPNIPEFVMVYYAIAAIGAVAVSINVMNKHDEVLHIVNDCDAKVLITAEDVLDQAPNIGEAEKLQVIYSVGPAGKSDLLPSGVRPFDELLETDLTLPYCENMNSSDPVAILYTSGTTGKAKGAVLTHGNVISNVYATNYHTGMTRSDALICYLPLSHCFGQNFIMNSTINAGARLILHRRFDSESIFSSLIVNKVSMFFGVPTAYNRLLQIPGVERYFDDIRYFFSAAATLSVKIEKDWQARIGKVIHQGYGLTECSPFAAYNHDFAYQVGSVGAPIENVEMEIIDADGEKMKPGELGEIAIKGPNVMQGYYNKPEETAQAIRDGWLHSGDIGYRDDRGYFFIVDRIKDMINVAGYKVWPREVEEVLYYHPKVREVAVVGVPDEDTGETVKAVIVSEEGSDLSEDEIIAYCGEKMAAYKIPKLVKLLESLPKNAAGKILKKDLKNK
jgi:long-chain acyl-CoA synthetase